MQQFANYTGIANVAKPFVTRDLRNAGGPHAIVIYEYVYRAEIAVSQHNFGMESPAPDDVVRAGSASTVYASARSLVHFLPLESACIKIKRFSGTAFLAASWWEHGGTGGGGGS